MHLPIHPDSTNGQQGRVLVVDDNASNREMLSRRLERWGYDVSVSTNGRGALREVRASPYDLVLLDIMMPELNGYEVLEMMKADEELRHLPVLMISAVDDLDSVIRCIELGADDFLPKPFNPTLLRARVESSLAKKRLNDRERLYAMSLEKELQIGRQIQEDFLPRGLPEADGWEIAARFRPALQVSGDFYDAFALPGGRIGFMVGDVCGKGVGAALFMALVRSLLRAFADHAAASEDVTGASVLLEAIADTNGYLSRVHHNAHTFASVFMAVLDPASGHVHYVNAGHEPPIIRRNGSGIERLWPTGPAVGLLAGAPFATGSTFLHPGDSLLIFTDGVTDARNADGAFYTEERLLDVVSAEERDATSLLDFIEDSVCTFCARTQPYDDVTLLALRRLPDAA